MQKLTLFTDQSDSEYKRLVKAMAAVDLALVEFELKSHEDPDLAANYPNVRSFPVLMVEQEGMPPVMSVGTDAILELFELPALRQVSTEAREKFRSQKPATKPKKSSAQSGEYADEPQ